MVFFVIFCRTWNFFIILHYEQQETPHSTFLSTSISRLWILWLGYRIYQCCKWDRATWWSKQTTKLNNLVAQIRTWWSTNFRLSHIQKKWITLITDNRKIYRQMWNLHITIMDIYFVCSPCSKMWCEFSNNYLEVWNQSVWPIISKNTHFDKHSERSQISKWFWTETSENVCACIGWPSVGKCWHKLDIKENFFPDSEHAHGVEFCIASEAVILTYRNNCWPANYWHLCDL